MTTKRVLLISFCMFVCLMGFAQSNIPLTPESPIGGGGGKSQTLIPTIALDGSVLTIDFPEATASQIIISDQSTNAVV